MNFSDILKEMYRIEHEKEKVPDMTPLYGMYEKLIEAGFTEKQAMTIIITTITEIVRGSLS